VRSTVVLWWPAGGWVDGSFERHFGQENSGSGPFPSAGWFHSPLENSEPSCQAPRRRHAQRCLEHVGTVGLHSSWAGSLHLPQPPARSDSGRSGCRDEGLVACLRRQTPLPWVPRAWAALRYDERREVNKKKVHRLWREEGLQVKVNSPRKRAGVSSVPPIEADAPNVVWAIDFQFDSTIDGKAIKIASMIDEHTRESLLNLVERSITGEDLVDELEKVFAAAGGPPKVLRLDNGPEMISQALQQFCNGKAGMSYIPPGCPWVNGYIESFNNRLRKDCLNRNHWNTLLEARVVIGDFKDEHNRRHRHSALGYRTPAEYAATCRCTHTPVACEIN